ncbi:hypothetical protein ALC56_12645 [Trachymyrmex septentrionalis]|uniref:Uncharacterized protein n=1 Tax=Trachymyrmex septentrionalis TaxID=34720 RepID=A0A195EXY5_9HYME|nr:hypothetical protein ALC56_12645 [Trachymyrmex septentrionalis]
MKCSPSGDHRSSVVSGASVLAMSFLLITSHNSMPLLRLPNPAKSNISHHIAINNFYNCTFQNYSIKKDRHNYLAYNKGYGWFPSRKISAITREFKRTDFGSLDFCDNLPCLAQHDFNFRCIRPCKVLTIWTEEHSLTDGGPYAKFIPLDPLTAVSVTCDVSNTAVTANNLEAISSHSMP